MIFTCTCACGRHPKDGPSAGVRWRQPSCRAAPESTGSPGRRDERERSRPERSGVAVGAFAKRPWPRGVSGLRQFILPALTKPDLESCPRRSREI
jgi:hypothetical protein